MHHSFIATLLLSILISCNSPVSFNSIPEPKPVLSKTLLQQKATEALQFCKAKSYNTNFCLLADMGLHSGTNRLVIWDFKKDTIIHSCMVGHGCCNNPWSFDWSKSNPTFSNTDGSHCSALGKYKIGERGYSSWGIHVKYLLHGLDSTNRNALARQIVLHSWEKMEDAEVYPAGSPEGWGCPTVSDNNMRLIDEKLKTTDKPTLLWMFK